jgi:DNA polymerase-3 subunit gamma/tau
MAYQTLYRRYRPRRFSDVRGQEHVVRALRNAVREDRVGHAYLFSGPRGTGKTSTARILAKALNCEHLDGGEPDGTCDSCLAIDAGTSYDVQELDAASNNKVEDIRDLIGRVALGSPGRTKVYILDEVHMLTPAASASLLKTLEEPPDHVVFVLATTDPQKVLPTIRSRTQHFDFHLLSAEELSEHVAWVIHDAGLDLGPDAIEYVVRQGRGSARDTLSALDQVAAAGGVLDRGDAVAALLDAIAEADAGAALVAVADAVASGRDPRVLGEAVLGRLRDIFLIRMGGSTQHLPPGDVDVVSAWAAKLGDRATTRALELVGDALLEMRQAPDPRIPLEVALVKISRPEGDSSIDALTARVAALEAALASGASAPAAAPAASAPAPASPPAAAPRGSSQAEPAVPATLPAAAPAAAASSSSSPAPAGGARPRPADAARAQLAAQRSQHQASGSGRAASPAPPATPPPSSDPPADPPAAEPQSTPAAPEPATAADPPPPPPAPSTPEQATAAEEPLASEPAPKPAPPAEKPSPEPALATAAPLAPVGDLTMLWNDQVLPQLKGLAKSMYATATLVSAEGPKAVIAAENDNHRQHLERKRADVERALSASLGREVRIELVTGGGSSAPPPSVASSGPAAPTDDDPLGGADVHDLEDAPDAPTGGLDALTEAFPGSELIEER